MPKERECEEVATLNGVVYKFAGTFGFIERLAVLGKDPAYIFEELSSGSLPPTHIKNVLSCALETIDGKDIIGDNDKSDVVERFIEAAGLQDSSLIARIMMSHAMIGSIKKKKMREGEEIESLFLKSKNFRLRNLKRAGLSLAVITLISAIVISMISYF